MGNFSLTTRLGTLGTRSRSSVLAFVESQCRLPDMSAGEALRSCRIAQIDIRWALGAVTC